MASSSGGCSGRDEVTSSSDGRGGGRDEVASGSGGPVSVGRWSSGGCGGLTAVGAAMWFSIYINRFLQRQNGDALASGKSLQSVLHFLSTKIKYVTC